MHFNSLAVTTSERIEVWRSYLDGAFPYVIDAISPQTGFFHFHRKMYEGAPSLAVPFYENVMVVLFLLRTKHQEHVHRAKELLLKLFQFQIEQDGLISFPSAIHEYPKPAHDSILFSIMVVLWQIKRDFQTILGAILLPK